MSTVVFKRKVKKANVIRKRSRDDQTDGSESEEDIVRGKSRSGPAGIAIATKKGTQDDSLDIMYIGDRSNLNKNINDATREAADIDGHNEASLLGRTSASQHKTDRDAPTIRDTLKGTRKTKSGPIKAPSNIRGITVIDYQPDVCKDYKQTGFCGFGDTCKFLHDRGDFKQGWQLDRDWEDVGKNSKSSSTELTRNKTTTDADVSDIPFKCIICKEDYKNPIITRCGHYFCETCALGRFKKTPNCAQCGVGTGGLFSGAKKLKSLLQQKHARITSEASEQTNAESPTGD